MANDDRELWMHEGSPVSEAQVVNLERAIGWKLPTDYRAFLLLHNGGRPQYRDAFSVRNWRGVDSDSGLQCLFGIDRPIESENLEWGISVYRGRVPASMLPIGCSGFGDLILLGLKGEYSGVYLWDHENESGSQGICNVYPVASSFRVFLEMLWEFKLPSDGELEDAIKKNDVDKLVRCLAQLTDLEARDNWGRTMMERAAISNAVDVIAYLFAHGSKLGNALAIAEENLKFFPEHRRSVELLRTLSHPVH